MALPSGPSFIPKQNTVKVARRGNARQVYVFTIISYTLLVASLVAVAAVFLYDRYTKRVLAEEVTSLSKAIASFSPEDMNKVIELDERLRSTETKLENSISVSAVLGILEKATIDTVQFTDLQFSRDEDKNIAVSAGITTDSFDSVLFQRGIYEAATDLATVRVEEVEIDLGGDINENGVPLTGPLQPVVRFSGVFSVSNDAVRYEAPTSTPAILPTPSSTVPLAPSLPATTTNP